MNRDVKIATVFIFNSNTISIKFKQIKFQCLDAVGFTNQCVKYFVQTFAQNQTRQLNFGKYLIGSSVASFRFRGRFGVSALCNPFLARTGPSLSGLRHWSMREKFPNEKLPVSRL
ncbi:hypothetical protein [Hymenobacter koreensis]|uniref:hypothetical protein n=1 Tax=Hymenobacter koreensis TaxID=1084523 RepID=UPI0031ECC492